MVASRVVALAGACLLVLAACDRRVTREPHGRMTLVQHSWTIPGPCPKDMGESALYGADGELVLDGARFLGESAGGRWSLWTAGERLELFAIRPAHRCGRRAAGRRQRLGRLGVAGR
jgi:hypothetical protein